jgi:integrase
MSTTKRTGTLEGPFRDASGKQFWRGKVRLRDGSRARVEIPAAKRESETASRNYVAWAQEQEDATHAIYLAKIGKAMRAATPIAPVSTDEGDRWFGDWESARKARGLSSTRDNRNHFMSYIRPAVRGKHVRDWTSEDVRAIVASLDAKIAADEISAKYARNVWGTATKMCADAVKSKVEALRVRNDNPARDVEGPDSGDERAKQFLYPSEFVQLVACEDIAMRWRRAIALAIYMFPRAGELRALRWEDVDLAHGLVHVHQAFDRRTREVSTTKSGKGRRVPIEPALVPLLRVMHAERDATGLVCPMPNRMASRLREWLGKAKITRRELTDETSKTTKPLAWHDLRATGLTWCAVRGDEAMKIMQRAGHEDIATTMIYVRTADTIGTSFGDVFPPLPASLLGTLLGTSRAEAACGSVVPSEPARARKGRSPRSVTKHLSARNSERDTGFEPATSSLGSWHSTN